MWNSTLSATEFETIQGTGYEMTGVIEAVVGKK